MKKHTLLSEIVIFLAIFFLFIVLPLGIQFINTTATDFSEWSFPLSQMIMSFICFFLLYFYYEKEKDASPIILKAFPVIMTFGLLFCVSLLCKALSLLVTEEDSISALAVKPKSFVQWLFCILTFLFSAFNEEVIYRFYFSDKLNQLLSLKIKWPWLWIFCEVIGCALFAFGHFYLGWISVLNAALAHIILRVSYKKNGRLWPCVTSHFIYNIISLILL